MGRSRDCGRGTAGPQDTGEEMGWLPRGAFLLRWWTVVAAVGLNLRDVNRSSGQEMSELRMCLASPALAPGSGLHPSATCGAGTGQPLLQRTGQLTSQAS